MKTAIAYLRFSSPSQGDGNSLKRQKKLIDEWLKFHPEYQLDDTTYEDLGLSAFKGKHADSGAFADFMDALNHGLIAAGTVLLIESLDRLSREKIGDATERLKRILICDVDVVTLCDNTHYTKESLNDPYAIIKAILIAQRANEESEIKSSRVKDSWRRKREDAEKTGAIMTRACPRWLKVSDDRKSFEVIEENVNTITKIFSLRKENASLHRITKYLNDRNIKTLSGVEGQWHPSSIQKILSNKALIGICTPSYRARNQGLTEIPNYYPKVLSEESFFEVQELRLAPFGRVVVKENPLLINLLRTILRCRYCNSTMIVTSVSGSHHGYYVCPMRRLHRCSAPLIKREMVDDIIIGCVLFNAREFESEPLNVDKTIQLNIRNIEVMLEIKNLISAIKLAPDVSSLADELRLLDKEFKRNETALQVIMSRNKKMNIKNIQDMDLRKKDDREQCRNYAYKTFQTITIDTVAKKCNIHFITGLCFNNFPLTKTLTVSSIKNALLYIDGETVYF